MAELKFKMLADYTQAIEGENKFADSLNKARKELQNTKTTSEDYSKVVDVYKQSLEGLTQVIDRNGGSMSDLKKVYDTAAKEMVRLAQSIGTSNEAYRKAAEIAEIYDKKIFDLTKKNEEAAKVEAQRAKKLKEEAEETERVEKMTQQLMAELDRNRLNGFSDAVDEINRSLREMEEEERQLLQLEAQKNQLNQQNANLGFMMLTGDDRGLATYSLREYENTLKRVIAETGINSEETKKAYEQYAKQKEYVDQLNESTKRYNTTKETSVKVEEKHSLKLLSVAKNILKFQLLMAPITAVIRGFKNTISDSLKVAAEAEQRFNKLATVFDGFEESAKRAASSLASMIGVAKSTSASALSTVGDLLQAQGMGTADSLLTASSWVKQFQDIIAFKDINMSLEEFAQNFMSGAAGNLRNFRTFGSIVKESAVNARLAAEGLDKLTGSQLELAKMTTRATLALEQQKNAMGATEREWDTMLSINRRLSEAWKQYKENLGETINSVLRPMKSAWADILDQINKARKAQEEYNKGNKNPDVYDMPNSASDRASFTKRMLALTPGGQSPLATVTSLDEMDALQSQYYSELKKIFIEFGATIEDVSSLMGDKLSGAIYAELKILDARRKAEKAFLDAQEARKAKLSSSADAFTALQETLLGIAGVNFNPTSITELVNRGMNSDREMQDAIDKMAFLTTDIITKSLDSLDTADLAQTWGDAISRELGELNEADLLQGKADSYRKLFEAAWNAYLPDGIDSEERLALEAIKRSYKEATSALEEYNKNIQRQNALLSANSTLASVLSNTSRLKYENGLTGPQSSKDLDMTLNWDIPLLIQDYAKALRESGVALDTVKERTDIYKKALVDEARFKYQIAVKAERDAQIAGVPTDARTAVANFGLSDREIKRNELVAKAGELAAKHDSLWIEYQKEIDALDELTKLEAQKALLDKVNPFASTMEAYSLGQSALGGGVMAGIAGVLADILSQTEAFSELTDIVSDTFVPIFNAILKPLMPALKAVTSLFDALPWDVFFDVFKIVSEAIVIISTVVKVISAVIKNIFTAVHNILQRILHPITGGDQKPYENIEKILQEADDNLEKIKNSSFKIERNTESDANVAALRELWHAGIIDNQGVYEGAKVLQKDLAFESLDGYAANVTYNITNNITVNANDEEGMNKFKRTMEENGIPLGYTFRVHGYSY